MFDFVRNNKRVMQGLLLVIIVPSFVFVGLESYQSGDAGAGVATVDGKKITQQEWEEAQRRQIDQARQMMGPQFDQKMFETAEAKQTILNNLVGERAIDAELNRAQLTVGDQALAKYISNIQIFRKPDGSFDKEAYQAWLASQGMTGPMFDQRLRRDMAVQHLAGSIQATAFAPRTVTTRLSNINDQQREVQELQFPIATYLPQVKVTDEMVKAYYDKNAQMFQIPEQVKAEYVVFDSSTVEGQVQVSDAEVLDYYNKNLKAYTTPEQRTASHILINLARDAKPTDQAAAKAKAEAVLAQVRANPANFAEIAKRESQDPGSAQAGGDLGVVEKGLFVKPVEDAIYGLKEGETSGLVQSEFGYHVIKVTKIVPSTQKSLDAAKEQIAADLKKQKMSAKYSELANVFGETVYDQSDSLKPVADKLKLQIQTADNLTRTPNPALGEAPFNNAKFLAALFSNDAIKNKRNTEAVEVAPTVLVAGRVVEFRPASKRALADVEAAIRQRVTLEEAARLARQAGEAKLNAVKASGDATGFGDTKVLSRTTPPTINQVAAIAALKADVSKLPAYVGVEVPGQGYSVVRIGKVSQPAQLDEARRKQEATQISELAGQQAMVDYVEALKVKAKAKVSVKGSELGNSDNGQ
ncbi:SurA N-terminal domain-containing protein [Massilia sp. YIM B02443]|uniref:SurA N-terminal domain-containing protein n=1 Tax=Massilia sp. YIM B02443 TaxID=3050127 RepID=UPI0025B6CDAD|nr:SurA N-terminal domain-containing protein [Massilia sp. YIM B02443]MDN4038592.1 SurA N-terminal domain-containing protein [Massilia sp. YIM B02443]